jgi:hypothetical protein
MTYIDIKLPTRADVAELRLPHQYLDFIGVRGLASPVLRKGRAIGCRHGRIKTFFIPTSPKPVAQGSS